MPEVIIYSNRRGKEQVSDYLRAVSRSGDGKALGQFGRVVELVEAEGIAIGLPHSRIIDRAGRLYELRFGNHRIAMAEHGGEIVLLNGWRKKSQKLDRQERDRALVKLEDWRQRHKK